MKVEGIKKIISSYWDMSHPEVDDFVNEMLKYAQQLPETDEDEIEEMASKEANKRYHQRNISAHGGFKLGYITGAKAIIKKLER